MDINNNMELDSFELRLDELLEGSVVSVDSDKITEDMVRDAIKRNLNINKNINRNVEIAVCDSIRNDLVEYVNNNSRGL